MNEDNLVQIEAKFEALIADIRGLLVEANKYIALEKQLSEQRSAVQQKAIEVAAQTKTVNEKLNNHELEKTAHEQQFASKEEKLAIQQNIHKQHVSELDVKEKALNDREQQLNKQSEDIEKRLAKVTELEIKTKDILDTEAMINREKTIDHERKLILDMREKKLEERENRVQQILGAA